MTRPGYHYAQRLRRGLRRYAVMKTVCRVYEKAGRARLQTRYRITSRHFTYNRARRVAQKANARAGTTQ